MDRILTSLLKIIMIMGFMVLGAITLISIVAILLLLGSNKSLKREIKSLKLTADPKTKTLPVKAKKDRK